MQLYPQQFFLYILKIQECFSFINNIYSALSLSFYLMWINVTQHKLTACFFCVGTGALTVWGWELLVSWPRLVLLTLEAAVLASPPLVTAFRHSGRRSDLLISVWGVRKIGTFVGNLYYTFIHQTHFFSTCKWCCCRLTCLPPLLGSAPSDIQTQ